LFHPLRGISSEEPEPLRAVSTSTASAASAAALRLAMWYASAAASSASGESGIVSRDETLGLRERNEVGVDGMEEEYPERENDVEV